MTREEKAQAYDEALEEAKKWIENPIVWNSKDICQKLFPSLVESKDERIRRKIVWCLKLIKEEGKEFLGSEPIDDCISYLERQKEKERKPILEVFGFKVGDAVRLKDGDGRKHIIKSFEEVEGLHGPNFYLVEFEDNSARDGIYPGEEYPNGYYTHMEKFEEGQKPEEKPINWTELTWKDINELEGIINNVHYEFRNGIGQESFGKEVLEKFREYKGDEYLDEAEQKYWRENEPKSEVGDDETEVQKAYREGKNAGRKEVFDHPEYYGLQPRRMYDYETGERNPEWSEENKEKGE